MKQKQCHEICFQDVENDWDNALPVGNGRLGAMVFFKDHALHISLNYYDCYYRHLPRPAGLSSGGRSVCTDSSQVFNDPARSLDTYEELCKKTDRLRKCGDTAHMHYSRMLRPATGRNRPSYQGTSYPEGGELLLFPDKALKNGSSCLKLLIEEARIIFEAQSGQKTVKAEIIAARQPDGILIKLSQSENGLWEENSWLNDALESDACFFSTPDLPFAGRTLTLAATLLPTPSDPSKTLHTLLTKEPEILDNHRIYWENFWCSHVSLPDAFLEHLWFLQLYLLECSNAKGSLYPEQSWGLNGLWDIKKPNMWGSTWYWDVNIQSSFWGTYTAGHPEFLKLFCDGYLSYEQDIRQYTRQVYGIDGWALDYPHTLYHCIQPWCAQFLWLYFQYTGDTLFLAQKAYPVFQEQIAFFRYLATKEEDGTLHINYDISPEQGPVTTDSVITISCIRKLFKITLEAARLLGRPQKETDGLEDLLSHLPGYPKTKDQRRYKDSHLAPDTLFFRHPSLLMPLFPGEEIEAPSPALSSFSHTGNLPGTGTEDSLQCWKETLQFTATHTETGTFGMGWLSAGAAKLGLGKDALMLLYEKGLDHTLHDNGLCYEESPRFLNYCHLTKPAHYLPVMMEAAGGILNAVNLMLLQTTPSGEIRVFPALPKGKEEINLYQVQYEAELEDARTGYEDWADAGFDGFLAPGGFRVSARQENFRVAFLKVESTRDARLKLLLPGELAPDGKPKSLERLMKKGEVISFGNDSDLKTETCFPKWQAQPLGHLAAWTHRRLFLGADPHTKYYQAVDAFTCPYLFGNEWKYPQTPFIFDFGPDSTPEAGCKDYGTAYARQTIFTGQCILYCNGPKRVGSWLYSVQKGYGFTEPDGIKGQRRKGPDALREDFLEGEQPALFRLKLPRGRYCLLIISGDEEEPSYTSFLLPGHGTQADTGILPAGRYGNVPLPFILPRDGEVLLLISSKPGYRWKLNAIFVNKEGGL